MQFKRFFGLDSKLEVRKINNDKILQDYISKHIIGLYCMIIGASSFLSYKYFYLDKEKFIYNFNAFTNHNNNNLLESFQQIDLKKIYGFHLDIIIKKLQLLAKNQVKIKNYQKLTSLVCISNQIVISNIDRIIPILLFYEIFLIEENMIEQLKNNDDFMLSLIEFFNIFNHEPSLLPAILNKNIQAFYILLRLQKLYGIKVDISLLYLII